MFAQIADIVDTAVGSRIDLDNVLADARRYLAAVAAQAQTAAQMCWILL